MGYNQTEEQTNLNIVPKSHTRQQSGMLRWQQEAVMKLSERIRADRDGENDTARADDLAYYEQEVTKLEEENEELLSYKKEVVDMADLMFQFTMQRLSDSR